jgi:hypothetical protein
MSELTIEQLIKIILGVVVVVAIVVGLYLLFKNKFFDFIKGLSVGNSTKVLLVLIK